MPRNRNLLRADVPKGVFKDDDLFAQNRDSIQNRVDDQLFVQNRDSLQSKRSGQIFKAPLIQAPPTHKIKVSENTNSNDGKTSALFYLGLFLLVALIIGGIIFANQKPAVLFCPTGFDKQKECDQDDMRCIKLGSCVSCPENALCSEEGLMEC